MALNQKKIKVVSACLAGVHCRYDCEARPNQDVIDMVARGEAIPVCPEQLGGLSTPRTQAEIQGDKVVDIKGKDVTREYQNGATEALNIAKLAGATEAILKSKSPMCGSGKIYDGTFKGKLTDGDGIFARLLKKAGIKISTRD